MSIIGTDTILTFDCTPVMDTAAASSGDVSAVPIEIPDVFDHKSQSVLLQSLTLLDESDQGIALDIVFLNANGSLGALNAAVAPTDAVAATITGIVSIVAGDYVDLANSQFAIPQFNPIVLSAADNAGTSLWLGVVARASADFVAADDVIIRLGILR